MSNRKRVIADFVFIFLLSAGSFYLIKSRVPLIQDEYFHFDQIKRFINHDYSVNTLLMTIPGYHLLISVIARIVGAKSSMQISVIAWMVNLIVIPVFYLTARKIEQKSAIIKTVQFSFFPLMFPFLHLIYTDILSLILVLTAIYLMYQKHYNLSGLVISLSMLVRQNNIFFLVLVNLMIFIHDFDKQKGWENIIRHLCRSFTFILGGIAFITYYRLNSGILMSDYARSYLHFTYSNLGNFYFLLFLYFFLFLPMNFFNFPRITRLVVKFKLIIPGMVLCYFFFRQTFVNDHPFNQATWFLRNWILVTANRSLMAKSIFFFFMAYAILSVGVSKLYERRLVIVYPFIFFYLFPYWLIEVRYYLIPFALFMLFRKTVPKYIEYATLIMYIVISLYFVYGIANYRFFL